jgi:hypothetical protein
VQMHSAIRSVPLNVDSSRLFREQVLALVSDLGSLSVTANEVDLRAFFQMKRTPAA